jgi:hypothetical protein
MRILLLSITALLSYCLLFSSNLNSCTLYEIGNGNFGHSYNSNNLGIVDLSSKSSILSPENSILSAMYYHTDTVNTSVPSVDNDEIIVLIGLNTTFEAYSSTSESLYSGESPIEGMGIGSIGIQAGTRFSNNYEVSISLAAIDSREPFFERDDNVITTMNNITFTGYYIINNIRIGLGYDYFFDVNVIDKIDNNTYRFDNGNGIQLDFSYIFDLASNWEVIGGSKFRWSDIDYSSSTSIPFSPDIFNNDFGINFYALISYKI